MACEVNFVVNHEQQHQTEEEKMEAMWLDLVRSQTDYCLRLMAHVQTSRSASEYDEVNLLSHLGLVMEDVRKGYDGFRERCANIRQAPFSDPPSFAKVSYKFTDIQLRNYQARKKLQQRDETNAVWLSYLESEIPKLKEKTKSHKQVNEVLKEPTDHQSKKRKRSVKSVEQAQISLKENQPTASLAQGKTEATKKPRAPRKPKTNPRQQEVPLQPSFVEDYSSLL